MLVQLVFLQSTFRAKRRKEDGGKGLGDKISLSVKNLVFRWLLNTSFLQYLDKFRIL